MRFSVCIPTVRVTTLAHAVESVRLQSFTDWELLVIGQGSEQALLREATERAAAGDPRIKYLHLDRRGLSSARNAGIAATTGELVAFLDDDCEARADWLAELDACFDPEIDLVGGEVTAPVFDKRLFAVCPEIHPDEITVHPDGLALPPGFGLLGANMAVRRSAALRVGPFDECLGAGSTFAGAEEHDYCFRLRSQGARLRCTSRASVQHTYGCRFGVVDFYNYKRDRLGADGAFAAKRRMLQSPFADSVNANVWSEFRAQVGTVNVARLPLSMFRLYHYLRCYRQCLQGYELSSQSAADRATAVLQLA